MSRPSAPPPRRLDQRLDAEIAAAHEPSVRAVLEVQRAVLDLRHGREARARQALNRLHGESLRLADARLAGWLQLAEGQWIYFSSFGSEACERFQQALALAAGDAVLAAHADAWVAQWAAVHRQQELFVRHAARAMAALEALGLQAAAVGFRLACALGTAWALAGDVEAARYWDFQARLFAGQQGDDAGLAAAVYNQTQQRVARLRREALDGEPREAPGQLLGIDSVGNLDQIAGGAVRGDLTPLVRAQLLALMGRWAAAVALLEAQLPSVLANGLRQLGPSLLAELAWCRARLGDFELATRLADWASSLAPSITALGADADELVALRQRLIQAYELAGASARAEPHRVELQDALALERSQRSSWSEALSAAALRELPGL